MFMDGVMFMHSPRLPRLKEELSSPGFGELRRVVSDFSFGGDDNFHGTGSGVGNIRTDAALEPLGALGDLGWYNTRFSLWAFDYEMPATASAVVNKAYDNGVPMDMSVTLRWPGGRGLFFFGRLFFDGALARHTTNEDTSIGWRCCLSERHALCMWWTRKWTSVSICGVLRCPQG